MHLYYVALPCKRREFQPYEVPLVMLADRADLRCRTSLFHMSAVKAHPLAGYVRHEKFSLLHKICKLSESVTVSFFNLCNLIERCGNRYIAFLGCLITKSLIGILPLFIFVMLCRPEQLNYCILRINGISSVNLYCLSCQ